MKSFIISIIIFFILIILVITNSIYIHKTTDKMLEMSNSLLPNDAEGAEQLSLFWQKHHLFFSISIHDAKIERITELTENIRSAATLGNGAEFSKNIILLSELLEELQKIEEISFHGII